MRRRHLVSSGKKRRNCICTVAEVDKKKSATVCTYLGRRNLGGGVDFAFHKRNNQVDRKGDDLS
jgi:hypothetical protein